MFIVAGYCIMSANIRPCVLWRLLTIRTFPVTLSQDDVLVEVDSGMVP